MTLRTDCPENLFNNPPPPRDPHFHHTMQEAVEIVIYLDVGQNFQKYGVRYSALEA